VYLWQQQLQSQPQSLWQHHWQALLLLLLLHLQLPCQHLWQTQSQHLCHSQ
jgi:hypothetical protein